jgi:translation initiation factor IF-3
MQTPPVKDGPRINDDIRVPRVLLIDQNGEKQGEMPISAALEAAEEAGLDLVEIVPNANREGQVDDPVLRGRRQGQGDPSLPRP